MSPIERASIASLSADPANVRKHGAKNLEAIKASLRRFGQQKPIVVDRDGVVVAGNGQLAAAIALGWDSIDVVRTELRGVEAVAFAIADNRTAELAEWEDQALAEQLRALQSEAEGLDGVGFDEAEVDELIGKLSDELLDGADWPERDEPETKTVTLRYGRDDVDAMLAFARLDDVEDLEGGKAGKAILERIREIAASRPDQG